MLTNTILRFLIRLFGVFLLPIIPISTFIFGLIVTITFGQFLLVISIIWSTLFYFPLLALSFIYENYKICRPVAAIIGVPIALVGQVFVSLMPSMGENESKMAKLLSVNAFPFTYSIFHFKNPEKLRYLMKNENHYETLLKILYKEKRGFPLMAAYIDKNLLNN